jgi:hypothetical protein
MRAEEILADLARQPHQSPSIEHRPRSHQRDTIIHLQIPEIVGTLTTSERTEFGLYGVLIRLYLPLGCVTYELL